jgi:hypothetical protein
MIATNTSSRTLLMLVFLLIITQLAFVREIAAFAPTPRNCIANDKRHSRLSFSSPIPSLYLVKISFPSSDEAAEIGVRDWPQQTKGGVWEEYSKDGDVLVRYVLDGTGTLEIVENGKKSSNRLAPGTLIEIDGEAKISWTVSSTNMIILTPNFEEGKLFLAVAAIVVVTFLALLTLP